MENKTVEDINEVIWDIFHSPLNRSLYINNKKIEEDNNNNNNNKVKKEANGRTKKSK